MKVIRTIVYTLSLVTGMTCSAFAQETVTEKLEAKREAFTASASAEKVHDYEEGIKQVAASGVLENAKHVGDIAPDFTLPGATENPVSLSGLLKQGPVVLIWYRGEWCPYCNIYLEDIQKHIGEFKEAGANVVAVSPETPDHSWSMQDKKSLEFYVLSDQGSKVAEEYGVVYTLPPKIAEYMQSMFDIHSANADERDLLPLAASYVINTDGTITYAYLDADYRKRAETMILINEVKKLSAKEPVGE